jgi:hypothetical protein
MDVEVRGDDDSVLIELVMNLESPQSVNVLMSVMWKACV